MNIGIDVFRSRFARRLFIVFILSSILPVLALAILSFSKVTDQLLEHNMRQLHQETKAIGLSIFERLTFVETEFNSTALLLELGDKQTITPISNQLNERLKNKFQSLGWVTNHRYFSPLFGKMDQKVVFDMLNKNKIKSDKVEVVSLHSANDGDDLFMIRRFDSDDQNGGILVGQLNTHYLWSSRSIPDQYNLCILNHLNDIIFCLKSMPSDFFIQLDKKIPYSSNGNFKWTYKNNDFLASYWEIFLKGRFSINDWLVVLSTPKENSLQSTSDFQNTFSIVLGIALLTVLALSINQIRRILDPLKKLTLGIQSIGNINFDKKVNINSNDEFADLAKSFNGMTQRLSLQFQSLETMAEIDRLILSSLDSENIVRTVLTRIYDIIQCDHISIAIPNTDGEFKEMSFRERAAENKTTISAIDFLPEDNRRLCHNQQGIIIYLDQVSPKYLAPLKQRDASACLVLPLFLDNVLSAIIVLGYKTLPDNANQILHEARSWADRVTVALSNAKWQEKLYYQAHYDTLTGLPNRLALKDYLQQSLTQARRNQSSLAILFIDLDRFKLINDSLGHNVGDQYLKEVSRRINSCVRTTDMVARLGGDEFTIVILANSHRKSLNTVISLVTEKLLESITKPLFVEGHELRATASIGVSIYPKDADNIDDLMKNADAAMYHAKANSGNNYQYFCQEFNIAAKKQLEVENNIREALKNNEFELFFQPQLDTYTETLVGAEALIRWRHPQKGMISPADFIPIAEETIQIIDIDMWVLNAACAQMKTWLHKGYAALPIAVNMSARLFQQDHVLERLADVFAKLEIDAKYIELEITEGSLIEDIDKTLITLNELNDLGLKLAIDDFGTGYSSLSYLKRLPVHKLKIDQSFVRNFDTDEVDSALVKTIINLAHDLKLECIAEGVETTAQLEILRQHGCSQVQGYLFSAPLAVDDFTKQYLDN